MEKIKKFIRFWKEAIKHQIEKPKGKIFYFFLGFMVAHGLYNLVNLMNLKGS